MENFKNLSGSDLKMFISYLKGKGTVEHQTDFAKKLGTDKSYISQLIKSEEVNESFVDRIKFRFPVLIDWMQAKGIYIEPIPDIKPSMVSEPKTEYGMPNNAEIIKDLRYTIEIQKELIQSKEKMNEDLAMHLHIAREKVEKFNTLLKHHAELVEEEDIDVRRLEYVLEGIKKADAIYAN